ncbi:SURF1 family cytochrome oxidase biogenesis protein [Rhizohabitans arisaemae]|uniref:SURF1 family cytochrome oxidase biogenesis protein n=1 Tax=Rhizohabitans arisaemae TaxID=2720610 RepID=UPI0024B21B0C|nr:SURF1 family protein [Rhizohabitans arisaemae]
MYRFLLAPRWLALHLVVLLVIPGFVLLGQWQFGRFEDRSDLSHLTEQNLATPPVPLKSVVAVGAPVPAELVRRHVEVSGRYDPAGEWLIRHRYQNSKLGFYVVTPLITAEGETVLINRGWVPAAKTADARPEVPPPPPGQIQVTGRLRATETPESTGIADRTGLPAGQVLLIDVPKLAKAPAYGGYLELTRVRPAAVPAPEPLPAPDLGGGGGLNLAYAVQWWIFIGVAVVGWVFLIRREIKDVRAAAARSSAPAEPQPDRV